LYLKGRYYWWKGAPEEFRKSRDYFRQAVAADPTYALGYCGLNSYYGFGAAWGILSPGEGWPKAEEAIEKALGLDDQLAEALAVELNPRFDEGHYFYSFLLVVLGRFDEAVAECERALEIDPFSLRINQHLGDSFYYGRRYDEAIRQYRQTLELDPHNPSAHESLGDAYEQKGMLGEAVAEWRTAMVLAGDDELAAILSSAYAESGFNHAVRALAQERLKRLQDRVDRGEYVPAINFARAYVRLADQEQALQHLGEACGERNVYALLINNDPFYDRLRSDSRVSDQLRRVGLKS
jgi:tetratricopeptide (TPR) repeat protein